MPETLPFTCSYELDERLTRELVKLNQATYRLLQATLSGSYYDIKLDRDGMPDAVQYYLLYVAALVYGACDAALTLALHNLGREAEFLSVKSSSIGCARFTMRSVRMRHELPSIQRRFRRKRF